MCAEVAGRRRVVVVDNDPVMLRGTSSVLALSPEVEVVAAIDHDTALSWSGEWDCIDVAVVDASDARRRDDQFPGVEVVRAVRRASSGVTTVVLTGQYLHDGLRRRMWEAGADFFYPRDEGMTEEELISVVLNPDEHRRTAVLPASLPPELGVTSTTRANDLVLRLNSPEVSRALAPERRKKTDPHGERSRWWNQIRRQAAGQEGLVPVKASGESSPALDSPSIVQLRKFLTAMTRVDRKRQR
jgi:DNA-binding NarL/FixJ family response regulator